MHMEECNQIKFFTIQSDCKYQMDFFFFFSQHSSINVFKCLECHTQRKRLKVGGGRHMFRKVSGEKPSITCTLQLLLAPFLLSQSIPAQALTAVMATPSHELNKRAHSSRMVVTWVVTLSDPWTSESSIVPLLQTYKCQREELASWRSGNESDQGR